MIFFQNVRTLLFKIKDASLTRSITTSEMHYALFIVVSLVLVGSVSYRFLEGWSWLEAAYATIITMTTVGYGDLAPVTPGGQLFSIGFTLVAIAMAGYALSMVAAYVIDRRQIRVRRIMREQKMRQLSDLRDHMIVCGGGYVGKRVANEFNRSDIPFVVVEPREEVLRWTLLYLHKDYISKKIAQYHHLSYSEHDTTEYETMDVAEIAQTVDCLYLQEDPTQDRILIRAGIERAKGVVVSMEDDKDNLFVVLGARQIARRLGNPALRIITRVVDEENAGKLRAAGADKVVSPNLIGGFQMASHMLHPELGAFWDHMLYQDEQMLRFRELTVSEVPNLAGQTVEEVRRQRGQLVLAIKRNGHYEYTPEPALVLQENDVLIVMGAVNQPAAAADRSR